MVITQTPRILQEFNEHYKNLLGTKHTSYMQMQPNLTALYPPGISATAYTLTNDHLRPLVDPITLTEVKQAVFTLTKDKASGPDGFPIEFFQTYWDIVRDDIFQVVTAFYHNSLDLWRVKQAYITLIPKKMTHDR
jgi:hypothetical protein